MPGSIMPLPVMLEEEREKKSRVVPPPPTSVVVRYGYMKQVAELPYRGEERFGCGTRLIIETSRGTEIATMLTTTCPNSGCGSSVSRKEMLQYIENSGGKNYPFSTNGRIVRTADGDDLAEQARLDERKKPMIKFAKQQIEEMRLGMKLVDVELMLSGDRVIFHYSAEQWVDFRELVRTLAAEFQMRVEMHQVTARDEARITADYERCGQQCCCKQFLKVLKPVPMRAAKMQKATLDPSKISGRCGRLMCCLRYEQETYESLKARLPYRNTRMMTPDGPGSVQDTQILTQLVLMRMDSGEMQAYPLEALEKLSPEEDRRLRDEAAARAAAAPPPRVRPDRRSGSGSGGGPRRSGPPRQEHAEPRRPKPGAPLSDADVESAEGTNAATLPETSPQVRGDTPAEAPPEAGKEGTARRRGGRRSRRRRDAGPRDATAGSSTGASAGGDATSAQAGGDQKPKEGREGEGGKRRRRRRRGGGGSGRGGRGEATPPAS